MNNKKVISIFLGICMFLPITVYGISKVDIYGMEQGNDTDSVVFNGKNIYNKHYIVPSNALNEVLEGDVSTIEDYEGEFEMGDITYYLKSNLYIAKSVLYKNNSLEVELKDEFLVDDIDTIELQRKIIAVFKKSKLYKEDVDTIIKYTDVDGEEYEVGVNSYD